jgi:Mrp family chromosome partitioning ATPase
MLAGHLKKHVLVIEADLHSGLFATILGTRPARCIRQALHGARTMELPDWERCLVRSNEVDYVVTDTAAKEPIPTWSDYFQLLRFVLPRYDLVLVDLPEVVNSATAEVVRTACAVYLVTTPELPSLALAQQRFQELARWGVEQARQFAILNRWHKYDPTPADVAEILTHPVAAVVRNDYRAVQRVITESKVLGVDNEVGAAFLDFAYVLTGETNPNANTPKTSRLRLFRAS